MNNCIQNNQEQDNNTSKEHAIPNNTLANTAKRYAPIRLKQDTYNRLKKFKLTLGQEIDCKSFDGVISKLLDYVKNEIESVRKE